MPSGAVAAAVVGIATFGCSLHMGVTLLVLFLPSSKHEALKDGTEEGAGCTGRGAPGAPWCRVRYACARAQPLSPRGGPFLLSRVSACRHEICEMVVAAL